MKSSLKENLLALIKQKGEISYGDLVTYAMELGYKVDNMTRRMRELCAAGHIEPIMGVSRRGNEYIKGYKIKGYRSLTNVELQIASQAQLSKEMMDEIAGTIINTSSQVAPQEEKYPKLPKFTFKEE